MFNESDNVELMQLLQEARQAAEEMDDRETSQQGSQPFNAAEHFLAHHTPDWLCSGERPHTGTEDLPNNHSSSTYSTCTTPAATATRLEKMLPHQQVHKVAASPSSLHASPMMNLGDEDGNQQELLTSYAAWLREQAGHPASMQRSPAYITRNLSSDFDRAPHHHGPDGAMAANTWSIMEGGVHGGAEMVPTLQDSPPHRPSSLPLWPPTTERAWTYTASISTIVAPSPNQAQPQPQQQQPQVPVGGVAGLPSTLAFSSASMDEKQRCVGVAMMDRGQTPVGLVGATNPPSSSPLSMRLYTPDQQVLYRDATTHDVANKGWALLGRATLPASASMTVPHHIVGANPSDATPTWSTAMGRASPPIHPHAHASSPTNPAALATHPSERPPPRPQTAFLTSIAPWTEAAGGRPTSALRPSERRGQGNGVVRTSIHGNNNNNNNNTTMASANSPTGRIILSPNLVSRRGGMCADGSPTSQAAKPRLYPQHVLPGMGEASMASGSAPLVSLFVGTPTPTHPQHHHHHPPPHHNHSHSNTSGPYSQRRRNSSGGALSSTTSPGGILSSPGNTSGSGNNNASNREDVAALLRLLRGGSPVGAMQTSPALQSPVVFHRDEVHEEEVSLTVWELSRDQQGCRLLQAIFDKELHDGVMARLPPATVPHELDPNLLTSLKAEAYLQSVAIQRVLRAMEPRMAVIMSDAYGNFLVQKIFEVAPDAERCRLLRLPRLHLELGEVACSSHGTFAIQRLIETLRNPQEEEILFRALAINLLQLLTDVNGGHVLSKAVLYLRARYSTGDGLTGAEAKLVRQSDFLYQGICQHMLQVCQHRHGCCIIQRCLDFFGDIILTSATCVGEASARFDALVRQIIAHAPTLSVDPFGNYVLTHAVKVCYGKGRVYLIDELAQQLEKTSAPSPAQRRGREDGPGEGGVAASMDGTLPRWLALAYLCQNKFASNVMEQVLRFCSETTIRGVCRGLMQYAAAPHMNNNNNNNNSAAVPVLYDIVLNSFGNYVIQTLLTVAPVDELIHPETDGRSGMLPLLESYAPLLREKNFGKKVEAKLELARLRVAHRQA